MPTRRREVTGRVDTRYRHYKREETSRAPDCIKREVYPDRYPVAEAAIAEGSKVILFTLYWAILQQCSCVRGSSRRQPRRTVFRDRAVIGESYSLSYGIQGEQSLHLGDTLKTTHCFYVSFG